MTDLVDCHAHLADAECNLDLARKHEAILPAAGLYPTYLDLDACEELERLIRARRGELVAIGEVGLDHWKVKEPEQREIQREILLRQIRLAGELDLPLNIHSRSAGRHVVALLLEQGASRVQLHAFDGKPATALPLSCLLLETDSPVLSAVPGERNEPSEDEVAEAVTANSCRLYGAALQ